VAHERPPSSFFSRKADTLRPGTAETIFRKEVAPASDRCMRSGGEMFAVPCAFDSKSLLMAERAADMIKADCSS
jgi:hypothetical protein